MTDKTTENSHSPQPLGLGSTEGLGPLVEVLARWEDQNGTMAAILPSEWDALKQDVMDACVLQSPRMLRNELLALRTELTKANRGEFICLKCGLRQDAYDAGHAAAYPGF